MGTGSVKQLPNPFFIIIPLPPICNSPGLNLVYFLLIINTDKMKSTAWKSQMTFERLLQLLSFQINKRGSGG